MGCGSSKTKLDPLHTPLDCEMKETGVESVDNTFSSASKLIEKLEKIRSALIDGRDGLIIKTGASAYLKPDLNACLTSYFWLVSTYTQGGLQKLKIDITDEAPFFKISGCDIKKVNTATNTLTEYIKGVWAIKDECEAICEEMNSLSETISNESGNYIDQVKESCSEDFKKM
jgi:hypothetical protein